MTEPSKKGKDEIETEKKEKEEMEKQNLLNKEIKSMDDILKFTLEERKKLIAQKDKEIEQKDQLIKKIKDANENLKRELENLQIEVNNKFSKEEFFDKTPEEAYKLKKQHYEKEKKERLGSLIQRLNVKKYDLKTSVEIINQYKKEIDKLKKKIEKKVDLTELNNLTDEIKKVTTQNEILDYEIKELEETQKEHTFCEIEQNKLMKQIEELEKEISDKKKDNKRIIKNINNEESKIIQMKVNNKKPKEEIDQEIQDSLNEFWDQYQDKLNEYQDLNEEEVKEKMIENENNNNDNNIKKKKLFRSNFQIDEENKNKVRNKNLKSQRYLVERIRSNQIKSKIELPKITLFNSQEKKILLNVLPEKEIEKYEKRYECLDNAKNNLQRKYNLETKELEKQNNDILKRFEYSKLHVKQSEQNNKLLLSQLNEHRKELIDLNYQINNCIKNLEHQKNNIKEKDDENKSITKRLQEIQMKYEKAKPKNEHENDGEENENNENNESEHNEEDEAKDD